MTQTTDLSRSTYRYIHSPTTQLLTGTNIRMSMIRRLPVKIYLINMV